MAKKTAENTPPGPDSEPEAAHRQIRPTDEQFRLMVEQVQDYAIFMLDPQGHVASWNAGAEHIKHYRAQEIIGRHFSVFYTQEDVNSGLPGRELEIARSSGSFEAQGWRLRKDGSRFWAMVTITPMYDQSGELAGFGKLTRDLTEKRSTEESLQKSRTMFERLFESAPDAVVVVDDKGVIRRINQQAELLFGYLREQLVGMKVETLMPARFQKGHLQHRRGYFKDPRMRRMGTGVELYGCSREGREFPVDIMLNPIETGEGTWAFAVIRDITVQRENTARITELNRSLKVQIEQLSASNRELEAFSYSISHDLRAPLRHIIGFVDLLNERDLTALDAKSRHYLEVITQAAQKMGNLIDGLLAFSRMGRAELDKRTVDLDRLVREILRQQAEETRGREIDWEIAPLPAVAGDPAMLHLVLNHLIQNAVKFTKPRARARIEIGALEEDEETRVYVRDNGVGFDIRYVSKLFGLFQRLHSNEEFEGTGVGLAYVQRIVMRHGGRVWAEGALDGGATIWFALPKGAPGGAS
jgi:PAS domain S-box-containing protein